MRVKATLSYDGTKFFGFQKQKTTNLTVASSIESALCSIGIDSKVFGSGRTDRGVHATGQVIHFDLPLFWQKKSLKQLKQELNRKLDFIQFQSILEVKNEFHAQYSAKKRIYRYIIKTKEPTVFEKSFVSYYAIDNIETLSCALMLYRGRHNFKYFKKQGSYTSSDIRTIYRVKMVQLRDYIIIYFCADGYLRSQVRKMLEGALKVTFNELALKQLQEQIEGKKRHFTTLAKPQGLYLHRVIY